MQALHNWNYRPLLFIFMPNLTSFLNQQVYCVAKIEGDSFTIVRVTSMPTAASPKTRQGFDYTSLDAVTARFVQQQTGEIRALMKRTAQDIIELGQKLIAVKQTIGHGRFEDWLRAEFEWTQMTANRFMNVAKELKSNKLLDLTIAPSALYEIFAPSTPEAARNEAIARAKAGESITYTTAKTIKQKYAPPPKPKPEPISQPHPQSLPTPPTPAPPPQSGSKLEIVALRPQAQSLATPQAARSIVPQTGVTPSALRLDKTEAVPDVPGVWWQLGGKHLLYCGDPNSSEFLGRIPEKVSLLFAFPSTPNWQPSMQSSTRFILETLPEDKDARLFEDTLESILLLCSNIGDVVVSCFLPSPEILSLLNRQSRRGLFAEPDSKRVAAVLSDWKGAGLKVERVN